MFEAGAASRRLRHLGLKKKKNLNSRKQEVRLLTAPLQARKTPPHCIFKVFPLTNHVPSQTSGKKKFCSQLEIKMFFPGDYFLIAVCQSTGPAAFHLKSTHITHQMHFCCVLPVVALWLSVQTFHPPVLHKTHDFMVLRFCVILYCVYNYQHISCLPQDCIWTRSRTKCVAKGNQSHCVLRLI